MGAVMTRGQPLTTHRSPHRARLHLDAHCTYLRNVPQTLRQQWSSPTALGRHLLQQVCLAPPDALERAEAWNAVRDLRDLACLSCLRLQLRDVLAAQPHHGACRPPVFAVVFSPGLLSDPDGPSVVVAQQQVDTLAQAAGWTAPIVHTPTPARSRPPTLIAACGLSDPVSILLTPRNGSQADGFFTSNPGTAQDLHEFLAAEDALIASLGDRREYSQLYEQTADRWNALTSRP